MTDTRALTAGRPTGRRGQQILVGFVSLQQPAPALVTDPVWVVLPVNSTDVSIPLKWPRSFGTSLPSAGDVVTVIYDENYQPHLATWE